MTQDDIPSCRCDAHPKSDDLKKYMVVAECTNDYVVFCCQRCTEITHVAVIQVRMLKRAIEKAKYEVAMQRRGLDPKLIAMMNARKRGGLKVREEEHA